jgi:hypothetical protein
MCAAPSSKSESSIFALWTKLLKSHYLSFWALLPWQMSLFWLATTTNFHQWFVFFICLHNERAADQCWTFEFLTFLGLHPFPQVRDVEARTNGMADSLFRSLTEAHPHSVSSLEHQYRMCEDIMLLSNTLIYDDRLRCGNAEVSRRGLAIPRPTQRIQGSHACAPYGWCWIDSALEQSHRVIFFDTDAVPAVDARVGDAICNEVECDFIQQVGFFHLIFDRSLNLA